MPDFLYHHEIMKSITVTIKEWVSKVKKMGCDTQIIRIQCQDYLTFRGHDLKD